VPARNHRPVVPNESHNPYGARRNAPAPKSLFRYVSPYTVSLWVTLTPEFVSLALRRTPSDCSIEV
jgi:hypothetical protein